VYQRMLKELSSIHAQKVAAYSRSSGTK
jgi:hypothetical protein